MPSGRSIGCVKSTSSSIATSLAASVPARGASCRSSEIVEVAGVEGRGLTLNPKAAARAPRWLGSGPRLWTSSNRRASMSGDDATRTHVLIAFLVAITVGCDGGNDGVATQPPPATTTPEKGAATLEQAARSALTENRRLSVYVWNSRIPVGRALHRGRARVVARRGAEPASTRDVYRCACSRTGARSSRSVSTFRARDGDRARSPARAALAAQRAPSWSGRDAERARALRTPTVGPERSVRRLEKCAHGKNSLFRLGRNRGRRACLRRAGATDSGTPPPIQIGISSQQAGPSRATVRARIAFGTPSRAGRANPQLARLPAWSPPIEGGAVDDLPDHDPYPRAAANSTLAQVRSRLAPAASGTRSGRAASASTRRTPSFPATRSWVWRRSRWSGARSAAIAASVARRLALTRPHPYVASRDRSHRRDSLVLARPAPRSRS